MRSYNVEYLKTGFMLPSESLKIVQTTRTADLERVAAPKKVSTEWASQIASNMPTNLAFIECTSDEIKIVMKLRECRYLMTLSTSIHNVG